MDPLVRIRIRIRTKILWIRNTAINYSILSACAPKFIDVLTKLPTILILKNLYSHMPYTYLFAVAIREHLSYEANKFAKM
jgi:hypothetical protein